MYFPMTLDINFGKRRIGVTVITNKQASWECLERMTYEMFSSDVLHFCMYLYRACLHIMTVESFVKRSS